MAFSELDTQGIHAHVEDAPAPIKELSEGVQILSSLIEGKLADNPDRPVLVMLGGRTSSGKTTAVTEKLRAKFSDSTSVFSMDDYFMGDKWLSGEHEKGRLEVNWDHPDYLNRALVVDHLERIARGETVDKPIFDFKEGEAVAIEPYTPTPLVIVEGIYALHSDFADKADISAFVDISLHGSIMRRLMRDVSRTGMQPHEILDSYLKVVEPMYQQHVVSTKSNADLILVNERRSVEESEVLDPELQQKYRVEDGFDFEKRLKEAGAMTMVNRPQFDAYFDSQETPFAQTGESIRIRKEGPVYTLGYKAPRQESLVRKRPRLELEIPKELAEMVSDAYGGPLKVIQKYRKGYILEGQRVYVDYVEKIDGKSRTDLGEFVELHFDREDEVEEVCREFQDFFGIGENDIISTSYAEM